MAELGVRLRLKITTGPFARRLPHDLPALAAHGRALARFLAVGAIGLSVDLAVFTLVAHALPEGAARVLSLAAATWVTWRLNRRFTFSSGRLLPLAEASRYTLVALLAQGLNWSIFIMLRAAVPWLPAQAAVIAAATLAAAFSYLGQRAFTFRPRPALPHAA